jgi:hypothetical protein
MSAIATTRRALSGLAREWTRGAAVGGARQMAIIPESKEQREARKAERPDFFGVTPHVDSRQGCCT